MSVTRSETNYLKPSYVFLNCIPSHGSIRVYIFAAETEDQVQVINERKWEHLVSLSKEQIALHPLLINLSISYQMK